MIFHFLEIKKNLNFFFKVEFVKKNAKGIFIFENQRR